MKLYQTGLNLRLWLSDLLTPADKTSESLDKASSAGEKFGLALAGAIDLVTSPVQWLVDQFKWISENMPSWDTIGEGVKRQLLQLFPPSTPSRLLKRQKCQTICMTPIILHHNLSKMDWWLGW